MKKVEETRKEEVISHHQNMRLILPCLFEDAFPQVGCIIKYHYMLSGLNVTYTVVSMNLAILFGESESRRIFFVISMCLRFYYFLLR